MVSGVVVGAGPADGVVVGVGPADGVVVQAGGELPGCVDEGQPRPADQVDRSLVLDVLQRVELFVVHGAVNRLGQQG